MFITQSCWVWHHVLCSNLAKPPRNVLRNFFRYPTLQSWKHTFFLKPCWIYVRLNGIFFQEVHKVTGVRNSIHKLCDASRRITVDMETQSASNFGKRQRNFSTSYCKHTLWRRSKRTRTWKQASLNSEINPTRCNNCVYSSQWLYSTCFGWQFHPSSGVQCCIWPFR